jgi:hypothetical protein
MGGNDQRFTEGDKRDEDLRENPGIGQSKGTTIVGHDVEADEGDNTVEGDVENDPGPQGQVSENKLGRSNS